jgi:DNA processing protein
MTKGKQDPRLPWIALNNISNLATAVIPQLVERFGGARQVCEADARALEACEFLTPAALKHVLEERGDWDRARAELDFALAAGAEPLTPDSAQYPHPLTRIPDPPPVLYVRGALPEDYDRAVAIVGTRKCSGYGRDMARELGGALAGAGISVISGLAHGIDTAAHQGAVRAGGHTLAVLGSGLNVIYPSVNQRLTQEILDAGGGLASEFPMDTGPEKWNFPRRNRIVSGLCRGVVVIEAPDKSGALITAAMAAEQGRDVFAVPGNVKNRLNAGPHRLIREGACLVESVDDILDALNFAPRQTTLELGPRLTGDEELFYNEISAAPQDLDSLCRRCGAPASRALPALTMLEMKGLVRQLPGKLFVKPG